MKKFLFTCFSLLLISVNSWSYTIDLGENDKEKDSSKVADFLKKSFSGGISHTQLISNDDNERSYSAVNLRFDQQFDNFRVVADGLFEKVEIKIEQNIQGSSGGAVVSQDRRVIEYSRDKARANDVYISYDLGEYATISAGLKRFTFGQFEPYSPTNFSLPLNLTSTGTTFSKLTSAIAQEFASLEVFPAPWISLQYIYMPSVTVDDLLEKNINQGRTELVADGGGGFNSVQTGLYDPDWQNRDQHAFRIMLYPDWGTLGLTYFEGYRSWFETDFERISEVRGLAGSFYESGAPGLSKQNMAAFELAIPINKFNFKFEFARFFDATYSIYDTDSSILSAALTGGAAPAGFQGDFAAGSEFYRRIRDENNGNLFFDYDYNIAAIGFDADLEKWYLNFALFIINEEFDDRQQQLLDLRDQGFAHLEIEDEQIVYPILNVARYLDRGKTEKLGVILGIVGNGQGAALYYNKEYRESITLGLALAMIEYFSDGQIEDDFERRFDNANSVSYEKTEDFSNALVVSLGYKF